MDELSVLIPLGAARVSLSIHFHYDGNLTESPYVEPQIGLAQVAVPVEEFSEIRPAANACALNS